MACTTTATGTPGHSRSGGAGGAATGPSRRRSARELLALYADFYPRGELRLDQFKPRTEVHGFPAWLEGEQASAFRWVPRDVRVLDIGCGFGESLAYHAARGCDAHGIDADANLLRVAERYGLNARVGLFDAADYDPRASTSHPRSGDRACHGPAGVPCRGGDGPSSRWHGDRGDTERRWLRTADVRRSLDQLAHPLPPPPLHPRVAPSAGLDRRPRGGLDADGHELALALVPGAAPRRYPPPGAPSRVWDPRRSTLPRHRRRKRYANRLYRFRVVHVATRATDLVGSGDNLLCVLRRPADQPRALGRGRRGRRNDPRHPAGPPAAGRHRTVRPRPTQAD